jgi:hypothetical protein
MAKKSKRKTIDGVLISLGIVATISLLILGSLAYWAYNFTTTNVRSQLVSQKIYFPAKGSPELSPSEFPSLQQYAGEQVVNGPMAKAYADEFIGKHLTEVAGGQTYSQVSAESIANPNNQQLKQEAQTLFQGETLRGLLLGDAYAFWTVGNIARIFAVVCFVAAAVMVILVLMGLGHLSMIS